jgi:hypothetical protein
MGPPQTRILHDPKKNGVLCSVCIACRHTQSIIFQNQKAEESFPYSVFHGCFRSGPRLCSDFLARKTLPYKIPLLLFDSMDNRWSCQPSNHLTGYTGDIVINSFEVSSIRSLQPPLHFSARSPLGERKNEQKVV